MRWKVSLRPLARKQLRQLDGPQQEEVRDILLDLEEGYFPDGAIQLEDHPRFERAKFYREAYRIVYRVNQRNRIVKVSHIGKRDAGTYKGFQPKRTKRQ